MSSKNVDQRVVQMEFDNRSFEQKTKETIRTLGKLKDSLNFGNADKGVDNLNNSIKKVNMNPLSNAIETVQLKFSAMQVVAATAIANITNSAVNAGKRIVDSLTIEPIRTGFQEYETQINAIQTILANTSNKGSTLADVNAALEELNIYADKTIYNFTEMTRNIGTFTAAGVDLKTSTEAIKGIANVAALSGSNSQQASSAMYQLSQAMAAGKVQLMDWNSVVNAGMGGEILQESLKDTARVHGIAVDEMIAKHGSFRESLQEGWITTEIMTETLKKFTGDLTEEQLKQMGYTDQQIQGIIKMGQTANDAATKVKTFTQLFDTLKESAQSGWTQSWGIIIGDFEEAKKLLTDISDAISEFINKSAEARNDMLKTWKELGGRTSMLNAFKNVISGLGSVIKPITQAFREIFPRTTGQQLFDITSKIEAFTGKLKLSKENMENLKTTFKGVFAVLDIFKRAFLSLVGVMGNTTGRVFPDMITVILKVTSTIGKFLIKLNETITEFKVFEVVAGYVKRAFNEIWDVVESIGNRLSERTGGIGKAVSVFSKTVGDAFSGLYDKLTGNKIVEVLGSILSGVGTVIDKLIDSFNNINFDNVTDLLSGGALATLALSFKKFMDGLSESIEHTGGVIKNIKGIFGDLRDILKSYQDQLKAKTLVNIATAVALLSGAIIALSLVDSQKLSMSTAILGALFVELMGALKLYDKLGPEIDGVTKSIALMNGLAVAVLILSTALVKMGNMKWDQIAKGLIGLTTISATLLLFCNMLNAKMSNLRKGALGLIGLSASLKILASACKDLGNLKWNQLAKGLVGITGLLTVLAGFLTVAKYGKLSIKTATSLVILASSLKILTGVVNELGQIKWKTIGRGLTAMLGILTSLTLFMRLSGSPKQMMSTGAGILAISYAMDNFAKVMNYIGNLKWKQIGKGLTGIAGILSAIAMTARMMPKNMVSISIGLLLVGEAVDNLVGVMERASGMKWGSIGKSFTAIGGSLVILALGLRAMDGTTKGAIALITASTALAVLTPCLLSLGKMNLGSIAKSLLMISGVFAVFAISARLLQGLVPTLLGVSASLGIFSLATIGLGVGLTAIGIGLKVVIDGLKALLNGIIEIATGIVDNITLLTKSLGLLLEGVLDVIIQNAPKLAEALIALLTGALDVLDKCIPDVVEKLCNIFIKSIKALTNFTGELVVVLADFIIGLFDSLADKVPAVIDSGIRLFGKIMNTIFKHLANANVADAKKAVTAIGMVAGLYAGLAAMKNIMKNAVISIGLMTVGLAGIVAVIGLLTTLPIDKVLDVSKGLSAVLVSMATTIAILSFIPISGAVMAVGSLGTFALGMTALLAILGGLRQIPGLDWLMKEGSEFLSTIGYAIGDFVGSIIGGIGAGISSGFPEIATNLTKFMENIQGFVQGAKGIDSSAMNGISSLTGAILKLTAADLLSSLTSWLTGGVDFEAFTTQIVKMGEALVKFSDTIKGKIDSASIEAAANAGKLLTEMASSIPNSGGLWSWIAGDNDMEEFANKLEPLADGLVKFSEKVKDKIDGGAVEAAVNAGNLLVTLSDSIPNSGGLWSWIAGDNDIEEFANKLPNVGKGLAGFASAVKDKIDAGAVEAAVNAGNLLVAMSKDIPTTGGLWGLIAGDNDLEDFGEQLQSLGNSLAKYSNSVKDVDGIKISDTANALTQLSIVADNIVATDISGVSSFSGMLPVLGNGINSFGNLIKGVTPASIGDGVAAVNSITNVVKAISAVDTTNVASFVTNLRDLGTMSVSNLAVMIQNGTNGVISSLTNLFNSMVDKVNNSKPLIMISFTNVIKDVLNIFDLYSPQFTTAGAKIISAFNTGVMTHGETAKTSVKITLSSLITTINNKYNEFYNAGKYLVEGFANGISDNILKAQIQARDMANAAELAAKKALDIHSPSRKFHKIGSFTAQGFINALTDYTKKAATAGMNLGQSSIDGINNAINSITSIISQNGNMDPVIKPVMDLSDIRRGMDTISNLSTDTRLYGDYTLGMVRSINVSDKGTNDEIKQLRDSIKDLITNLNESDESPREYTINVNTDIDGRNVAKATAIYTQEEINKLNRMKSRKGGIR